MASLGQARLHCPHWIQFVSERGFPEATITLRFFLSPSGESNNLSTPCPATLSQARTQSPHPMHLEGSMTMPFELSSS